MSDGLGPGASGEGVPLRTNPRGLFVKGLRGLAQSALPLVAMAFGSGGFGLGLLLLAPMFAAVIGVSLFFSWLRWRRFTYITGPTDIRTEYGIFSRSTRSVPYARIQDVSLEQKALARLLGLAEVRFETGAGGKDEITLAFLSLDEAERMRELVRSRRDGVVAEAVPVAAAESQPTAEPPPLFAMDRKRVLTFGLFRFSLVVFAVIFGGISQVDFLLPFDWWDVKVWWNLLEGGGHQLQGFGLGARIASLVLVVLLVIALGMLTGVATTLAREHGFRLDRTAKGFRRRRGLFNLTDVVLPAHRVQAADVTTGLLRRRFGWYGLSFVTLSQDAKGSGHHAVAPFATRDEVALVLRSAGIEPAHEGTPWQRSTPKPWIDDTVLHSLFFATLGLVGWLVFRQPWALPAAGVLILGTMFVNRLAWRKHRHATENGQLLVAKGALAPQVTLAPMVKLQTAEIVQSPLARWRGYATLHLGLAGGRLAVSGLLLDEARALRAELVERIAKVDFAALGR